MRLYELLESLDKDQKRVGQVGAAEKARKIGPVLGREPKQHPFKGRLVGEDTVQEVAPPGMEDWIKDRKADFKKRYGDRWQEVLYATAWKRKKNENLDQGVVEDVNTGPQIIYATGPRTMGINDVDLVFKDLRTGRIVAHVVGNNYHPGDDRLQEFAPFDRGNGGGGDDNQPKTAKYEIRMSNSKQPTYLALGDPQQDSKHKVYKLVSGKTDGPTYYGMGMTLVSNLDWWNFLEKMLGEIMWEDDAIEAGLVDRKNDGDLVFVKKQGVAEGSLKEFSPAGGEGGDNYGGDLYDILMGFISERYPDLFDHFGSDSLDSTVSNMVAMGSFGDIDSSSEDDLEDAVSQILVQLEDDALGESKGELWRVLEPRNIGGHAARYYIVKGQGKDLKIWRSKSGAGDFIKQADAEAKAAELNKGVAEGAITESQKIDFDGNKQQIIQFAKNVLAGQPGGGREQGNLFYHLLTGSTRVGDASRIGLSDEVQKLWRDYFSKAPFLGGAVAGEPWSQVNINDQFTKGTGDRTLNFYVTVNKDKENILNFFRNIQKLPGYLKPISDQYQTPIKFKTHSRLDAFIGHNDSLKVYWYDPKIKNLVADATRKWLSDSGIATGARTHDMGVDVKGAGGGSFGQILANHIYDTFTKLIQTQGNKYTPEQYFAWLKQNFNKLVSQVQPKNESVAEQTFQGDMMRQIYDKYRKPASPAEIRQVFKFLLNQYNEMSSEPEDWENDLYAVKDSIAKLKQLGNKASYFDLADALYSYDTEFREMMIDFSEEELDPALVDTLLNDVFFGAKQKIGVADMGNYKIDLGKPGVAEAMPMTSLTSRYVDDPKNPAFAAKQPTGKDPLDSLSGIVALRKTDPKRAFRALQDYGFRNPNDPVIVAASKIGNQVKQDLLQKKGITDPRPWDTTDEMSALIQKSIFDYIEKNLSKTGVAEGNKKSEPEADYGPEYQEMVARVKKLAGLGPLKTVWDPVKRVYKNVPVNPTQNQK